MEENNTTPQAAEVGETAKGGIFGVLTIISVIVLAAVGFTYTRMETARSSENADIPRNEEPGTPENQTPGNNESPASAPPPPPAPPSPPATQPEANTLPPRSGYRDGAYRVVGEYTAPSGAETVDISLTLRDGAIVEASGEVMTEHPVSKKFQELFLGSFRTEVVGKSLDEVTLGAVAGSSLTPLGFQNAVEKIKAEARG